jgi:hypothetical protein
MPHLRAQPHETSPCPTWSVRGCAGYGEWSVGMDRSGWSVGDRQAIVAACSRAVSGRRDGTRRLSGVAPLKGRVDQALCQARWLGQAAVPKRFSRRAAATDTRSSSAVSLIAAAVRSNRRGSRADGVDPRSVQVKVSLQKSYTQPERSHASSQRALTETGMSDRSSRPHRSPHPAPTRTERRIIKVRILRR